MKRMLCGMLLLSGIVSLPALAADKDKDAKANLEALKALNEFIGEWNGNGGPKNAKPGSKDLWSETVTWGWKFKGDDAWLHVKFKDGKYFKVGDVRYLTDKKKYELTLTDVKDNALVFEGDIKDEVLILERTDPDTKESQKITMNTAAEGIRLIYRAQHKKGGSTIWVPDYEVACNKAGESIASKEKKNPCIVTGALGTSTVSYKGQTYPVCCSGCRDAFNENPEKYIKEFMEKNKKK
jgi:hypothetical protein